MSEKLKPCPFCGSKNVKPDDPSETGYFGILCEDCGAVVIFGKDVETQTEEEAVAAWNKRAYETNVFMTGKHCTTITNADHLTINL